MDRGYSAIGRGLRISAKRFPDKPALIELDRLTLSYRALDEGANRMARLLARKGIGKGDHIAVLSDNSIEHMVALYAIARAGAVSVALDPKALAQDIGQYLRFFDCRLLIVDAELEHLVPDTEHLERGLVVYRKQAGRCDLLDQARDFSAEEPEQCVRDHDICTVILTSGTTGFPKGVMRTHRNVEMGCINGALGKAQDDTGRELAVVPLYYGSGRGSVIGQIYLGGTVYVMPRFDPERTAWLIEHERISAVAFAPTMCHRMLKVPNLERFDFSSLQSLRKAGSPFTEPMARELIAKVTPNLYQGYASTESGSVTLLRPHEQLAKIGSSGQLAWGVEVEIRDESGRAVPRGGEGEICVRGPNVFQGYYKNPEEQAKALRDGWYHTGDVGRFDEAGFLYVVGRIKEMIKTGSINVSPREIESAILAIDGVDDAAVMGVPDPEWGEAVQAVVVLKNGISLTEAELSRQCRGRLAGYKVPKRFVFTERIERNGLGKVTKEFKSRMAEEQRGPA
jgi:acyl-CoA synthetase (AMP-forming)/AMP-acid ligase II